MSNFLESLESRMFLSVSPLVTTLHTDEAAVKTAQIALKAGGAALIKTLAADLKAGNLLKTDKSQYKALAASLTQLAVGDRKAVAGATAKINALVKRLEAIEASLLKKPGNAKLTAKMSTDIAALTAAASAGLSAINTANSGSVVVPALNTIISDGGTVGSDASSGLSTLSTLAQALGTAATRAYSTDVSAITGT